MSVFDVPRSEWASFCERFASQNRGKRVSVEVIEYPDDPDSEPELLAEDMPLEDIAVTNREYGHMAIKLAGPGKRYTQFSLSEPDRLLLEQHGERQGGTLRVEGEEQSVIVRFAEPVIPGELDGMP